MWVKICGVRDSQSAAQVAECAPDAIGLNFFAGSTRRIALDDAVAICRSLPDHVEPVGLFVNHSLAEIQRAVDACGLKTVQLHGDEPAEFAANLEGVRIIRALRIGSDGLELLEQSFDEHRRAGADVRAFLVDAHVPGRYGGTGRRPPWDLLAAGYSSEWPPLILAGGLTDSNVARAISSVHPWGVDVASGVESDAGTIDIDRAAAFIAAARCQANDPVDT